jgi:hypothetical protein
MINKSLCKKPSEQALDYAMGKMELNDVPIESRWRSKYDWAKWSFASPLVKRFVVLSRRTERVEGSCPTRIVAVARLKIGKNITRGFARRRLRFLKRLSLKKIQRAV